MKKLEEQLKATKSAMLLLKKTNGYWSSLWKSLIWKENLWKQKKQQSVNAIGGGMPTQIHNIIYINPTLYN